jgi:uncharacterized C2H2 Zn-finger protein
MTTKRHEEGPSRNEDEYFAKQDAELMKQMRAKLDAERLAAERKQHFMKCPKCGGDLKETAMGNVTVDVCPDCGGTWLDAGELEIVRHVQKAGGNPFKSFFDLLPGKSSVRK